MEKLKIWIIEQVQWAETELKGKSGAEKKSAVLRRVDELLDLPWYLGWMTDETVLGGLIDWAVSKLNHMFGRDFGSEEASAEEVAAADVRTEAGLSLDAPADELARSVGA